MMMTMQTTSIAWNRCIRLHAKDRNKEMAPWWLQHDIRAWRWYHWYCDIANSRHKSIKTGCQISGGNNAILQCNSDATIQMPPSKHYHPDATILMQPSWCNYPEVTILMLPSWCYHLNNIYQSTALLQLPTWQFFLDATFPMPYCWI